MPKVSLAFFTVAPIYGLVGMVWGIVMGASNDHLLAPAHAHLNLLGLVLMGIMGAFYALAGPRAPQRLAWSAFWLSNAGVLILIPTLAQLLRADAAGAQRLIPIVAVGEVLAVLGLAAFLASVAWLWRDKSALQA